VARQLVTESNQARVRIEDRYYVMRCAEFVTRRNNVELNVTVVFVRRYLVPSHY